MNQYIDKDALAAEIKRRIKGLKECHADTVPGYAGEISGLKRLLSFLDTLEVKEVEEPSKDLEKEFDKCCENYIFDDECEVYTARKFFELGIKTQKGE